MAWHGMTCRIDRRTAVRQIQPFYSFSLYRVGSLCPGGVTGGEGGKWGGGYVTLHYIPGQDRTVRALWSNLVNARWVAGKKSSYAGVQDSVVVKLVNYCTVVLKSADRKQVSDLTTSPYPRIHACFFPNGLAPYCSITSAAYVIRLCTDIVNLGCAMGRCTEVHAPLLHTLPHGPLPLRCPTTTRRHSHQKTTTTYHCRRGS